MACTCHAQGTTESAPLAEEAMWSLALSATRRSAGMLPSALRTMPPGEALRSLQPDDPVSARRAWAVFGMMVIALGHHHRVRSRLLAAAMNRLSATWDELSLTPEQLPPLIAPYLSLVFLVPELLALRFLTALIVDLGLRHACGLPNALGSYDAVSGDTSLTASVVVFKPIEKVAPMLDPRCWDQCGDLFRRTCQVSEPVGPEPHCIDPEPACDGKGAWDGIIYERAGVGPVEAENLLSVCYAPPTKKSRKAEVGFRLYRSLSQRFGGWEAPGLFRRDSGSLTATPTVCNIPKLASNDCTQIAVTKTIRYGRQSTWSGSSLADFGELSNYLAPAFLTLWVTNVQLVVPCCAGGAAVAT